jgi:mono/diheme cytochrome c family protein
MRLVSDAGFMGDMTKHRLAATLGSLAFVLAGCTAIAPRPDDGGRAFAGRAVADAHCRDCHRIADDQAAMLAHGGPPFSVIARRPEVTDATLRQFLFETHAPMPNPMLNFNQQEAVIDYILSLRRP